jgi:cellulose synthase/poly-beta-1,6-N-acetylglucosamine synthase-like glycosyltransferase
MPGAGACYKRKCLLEIYTGHSGLRSGEDREATLLGLKLGYRTQYIDKVAIFTRPPLTFENLVRQRVRWNLGYLETCFKESDCYARQLKGGSRLGLVFLMDIIGVVFMVLLPVLILLAGLKSWPLALAVIAGTYLSGVLLCLAALLISPLEFSEIRGKLPLLIAYYPVYKYSLGSVSWLRAMFVFYKKWGHSAQQIRAGKLQTS